MGADGDSLQRVKNAVRELDQSNPLSCVKLHDAVSFHYKFDVGEPSWLPAVPAEDDLVTYVIQALSSSAVGNSNAVTPTTLLVYYETQHGATDSDPFIPTSFRLFLDRLRLAYANVHALRTAVVLPRGPDTITEASAALLPCVDCLRGVMYNALLPGTEGRLAVGLFRSCSRVLAQLCHDYPVTSANKSFATFEAARPPNNAYLNALVDHSVSLIALRFLQLNGRREEGLGHFYLSSAILPSAVSALNLLLYVFSHSLDSRELVVAKYKVHSILSSWINTCQQLGTDGEWRAGLRLAAETLSLVSAHVPPKWWYDTEEGVSASTYLYLHCGVDTDSFLRGVERQLRAWEVETGVAT